MLEHIAAIISALAASGAVYMSWRNSQKIQSVHIDINSRMDQLLQLTSTASHAEGRKEAENEARLDRKV